MNVVNIQFEPRIFDDLPVLVWMIEPNGTPAFFNKAALAFTGYESHTALAQEWFNSVHPEEQEAYLGTVQQAIERHESFAIEYRRRNGRGEYCQLSEHGTPLHDSAGAFQGCIGVMTNQTAHDFPQGIATRVGAEEAQARLTRILEATTDYVGMATLDGYSFYINAAGRKLVGLDAEENLDFHLSANHPDWANEIILKEAIPTAIRDGYWRGENALRHRSGKEIPVSQVVLSHRGADGKVEFISTIIRDLSEQKREEIERIEWANRYDAAIRASGQVLFDWNSVTHEIAYAGDTDHMFGYSIAELSGGLDRLRELIHPGDLPIFDERVHGVTVTRDPFHLEFRVAHKSAGCVYIEAKGYFFLDRRGGIGRMVGFFADVTARHQAQAALAQAQQSLEQRVAERTAELGRASAVIEDRAHYQEAVAQLGQRALSGTTLGRLMDAAMSVIRTVLHVDCCSLLALTQDGGELIARAQSGWQDENSGNRIPVGHGSQSGYTLLTGAPVIVADFDTETRFFASAAVRQMEIKSGLSVLVEGEDGPLGVLVAFSVARRAFTQDDVHFLQSVANVLTATIQREKAEQSIRQAREQAELASRAKTEFLSRMSHELRTPLNAILGFTQLMEQEKLGPTLGECVDHISRAGKHLLSLINEVLDISRIDAGRFALTSEPVEVHGFLAEAIESILPLARRYEITTSLEPAIAATPLLRVYADRQRLHQVIFNLLSNGVKFNRSGGHVKISYRVDGPRIRMTVADTGRGIEPEKLARLFLPFERLGAESTDIEGSGIGLALSRGIVTALQGELHVESHVGEGSTFWVTLPRAEEEEQDSVDTTTRAPIEAAPAPTRGADSRQTILYIEDQDLNLRLVERILIPRPQYRLITATTGGAGLEQARAHRPGLILLDLNLPDMTGDDVLHHLKTDPAIRHIPVIMVSADAMGDRVQHLFRLGASAYLTKPYKLDEFLRVIEETLA